MKIKRVEIYKADIPLVKTFRIALGETKVANNIFIRILTDEGMFGSGEASPFPPVVGETQASAFYVAQDFARLLIGRDTFDIEGSMKILTRYVAGNKTILSAFDMALYDLLGKASGLPLYAVLGGSRRILFTDRTVGLDSHEKMIEQALEYHAMGLNAIKVKLGKSVKEDISVINSMRAEIGFSQDIRIDANQGWDRTEAIKVLRSIEDQQIQFCEQPTAAWDHDSMRKIALESKIPIMADESVFDERDAFKLIRFSACNYLNIKLAKSAGIHTALKINAVAEAAGFKCMIGCMSETRLALTAAAHIASAKPNICWYDLDSAFTHTFDPVIGGMKYGEAGKIELPESAGLGAEIDPSYLSTLVSAVIE